MKKINIGDWAQTIATVGVIGGLVLLAFELHQNNRLLESQANLVLSQNRINALTLMATDDALGLAVTSGAKGDDLTELQVFKLQSFYVTIFTSWEWEYRQFRDGLISEERLPTSDWQHLINYWPGMKEFWTVEKDHGHTADFVQFIEDNVVNGG